MSFDAIDTLTPDDSDTRMLWVGVVLALVGTVIAVSPVPLVVPSKSLVFFEVGITFLLWGLLVLGLNLQYGFTGLVNFGHVAFFAVGAYATAMLTASETFKGIALGLPWPVGVVASVVAASLLGGLIGLTTLRLREDFLAVATLATAEIIHRLLSSFPSVTGGSVGLTGVPQPLFDLTGQSPNTSMLATAIVFAGVLAVFYALLVRITDAPYGRVLRAIRADDLVTKSLGKDVFSYRMQSFVLGAALAGLAGSLFSLYNGAVSPGFFTLNVTVLVWVGMLVGGPGNHRGVLGGLAFILGFRLLTRFANSSMSSVPVDFASLRLVVVGALLVAIVRYRPEGLWGNADELGVSRE
ncbi:branched-chain amino acid ABC transporter permease [Haloferax sp. YSMS24]|uniref:branched-chain amino acid ABC transporter permease n=1 Tax=unclassified Haloferax TaxID=2625095 RepID=UPI00398CC4E9